MNPVFRGYELRGLPVALPAFEIRQYAATAGGGELLLKGPASVPLIEVRDHNTLQITYDCKEPGLSDAIDCSSGTSTRDKP